MDKKRLQTEILESTYQPDKWLEVLTQYFGAKKFHQIPRQITLPVNDLAEKAVELGSFYTADERLIGIYEVNLTNKAWINKNRVGLRGLLRQVYKYDVDAALIVFVQDDKWRFSYVSEIRTEEGKKETEPKRYTYLFGNGESCRTAADRFDKFKDKPIYLNDLYDAFSVEKLNKDFFKSYKEYFELFSDYLAKQVGYRQLLLGSSADLEKGWKDEKAKPIRNFSKRLLGRIVFLHFLQKKGWMGVPATSKDWTNGDPKFLQNLFLTYPDKAHFHSRALRSLFFETLNLKRSPHHLAPAIIGENIKIPYLNGGLFDKDISFENKIDFPIDLFKNLFDFFEQYNFTIDENDPYDSEVGIDPEMLGHIFENLLEENNDKGAFYTPKEIVHYMCQESLIEYLHTQMPDCEKEDFEILVRNNQVAVAFTPYQKANEINEKLRSVKICDPAIGSGAFPMGLLKEIFECRRLLYGYLKTNDAFDPATVKKEIIQQNIYGVDIENGAVEIARLRFWLALVVDEKTPQPLPNLDYKIMQGNSLLEQFADIQLDKLINTGDEIMVQEKKQLTFGDDFEPATRTLTIFTQANKEHLYLLINKYFDPEAWEEKTGEKIEKADVKREINDFVEGKIHAHVLKQQRKLNEEISGFENKWKDVGVKDFGILNQKTKEYKLYLSWKDQREQLGETEEKLIALQKTEDKPYFLWHLWFKDVFDNSGFDIVIGNPPYIQLQKDSGLLAKQYENLNFESFERTGDIYSLFYEKGIQLLNNSGLLCYITSNKWLRTNYGASTRKFFSEKTYPILLIDFGNVQVFDAATVDTNIILLKNKPKALKYENHKLWAVRLDKSFNIREEGFVSYVIKNGYYLSSLTHNPWVIGEKDIYDIKSLVECQGISLFKWEKLIINYGIKTGFNDAFIIPSKIKEALIEEDAKSIEILKPILRGKDISAWYPDFENWWLIATFPSKKINIDLYPAIKKYLLNIGKDRLEQNGFGRKKTGNKWFETQDQISYWEDFEKPKIIYPNMTKYLPFVYDENDNFYSNDKSFILLGENLKYLVCFFNSKLFKYCFLDNFPELQGGTRELRKVFFDKIPVKKITDLDEIPFAKVVDYLVALKKENPKESIDQFMYIYFEQVADALVYELYFKAEFEKYNLFVANHIINLPDLKDNEEKILYQLRKIYVTINAQEHPINQAIFSMLSIPQIAIINNTNL